MSRSQQIKREPISDRNFVMPFGKYKGETVGNLIQDAPDYLAWLCQNTDFELDHILMDEVEHAYEDAARDAYLPSKRDIERATGFSLSDALD